MPLATEPRTNGAPPGQAARPATKREKPAGPTIPFPRLEGVEPVVPTFLASPLIPDNRLTVVCGKRFEGKSTVASWIGARLTKGEELFDGGTTSLEGPVGVLYLSCEEGPPNETFLTRFLAQGGDRAYVGHQHMPVGLPEMLDACERGIEAFEAQAGVKAGALILDPISAYLGDQVDEYKNRSVRLVLDPLAQLASRRRMAVIAISHPKKGLDTEDLMDNVMGSGAFTAVPRSVLMLFKDPDDSSRRMLSQVKGVGQPLTLSFGFNPYPTLVFGDRIEGDIRERLKGDEDAGSKGGAMGAAVALLRYHEEMFGTTLSPDALRTMQTLCGCTDRYFRKALRSEGWHYHGNQGYQRRAE